MGVSRSRYNDEVDALNAMADALTPEDDIALMRDVMREPSRYDREVAQRAMIAEFSKPNPILNAILNAKKPLEYDERMQELIVDGQRFAERDITPETRKAMEKVYRDAVTTGVGAYYVNPNEVFDSQPAKKKPKKKLKKTALLDHVELDL